MANRRRSWNRSWVDLLVGADGVHARSGNQRHLESCPGVQHLWRKFLCLARWALESASVGQREYYIQWNRYYAVQCKRLHEMGLHCVTECARVTEKVTDKENILLGALHVSVRADSAHSRPNGSKPSHYSSSGDLIRRRTSAAGASSSFSRWRWRLFLCRKSCCWTSLGPDCRRQQALRCSASYGHGAVSQPHSSDRRTGQAVAIGVG